VVQDLPPGRFTFSPDGAQLAIADVAGEMIRLCNIATGKEIRCWPIRQQYLWGLLFLPDGKRVVTADYKSLHVWAADTGKEIHRFGVDLAGGVITGALAASPSGRVLAWGGHRQWTEGDIARESGNIRVWDVISGEQIRKYDVPQGTVSSRAFTPDGRTLASGGRDSTILMWDMISTPKHARKQLPLTAGELDALWSALASDAGNAEQALWSFVRAPDQAVTHFKERLRSPGRTSIERAAKLIADLDSEQFRVRQNAIKALDELGEAAEGAAHTALESHPTLEARRRLENFLEKRKKEVFRKLRAIEVLEQVGTPDARKLLQMLVQEAPNPRVVEAAAAALQRLRTRG
jgi:WD40 repeat protein